MTRSYTEVDAEGSVSEVKFKNSQFLVFVNRVLALTVAGIYILLTRQPRHTAPLYSYSYSSFQTSCPAGVSMKHSSLSASQPKYSPRLPK